MPAPNFIQSKYRTLKVINQFLSASHVKDSSKARYRSALQAFLVFLGESTFSKITYEVIEVYKKSLEQRGLKPTTMYFYLCALRQFFKYAGYLDIAAGIKNIHIERNVRLSSDLSINQIKRLFKAIPKNTLLGLRDRAIVQTMIRTGLKASELARAQFKHLEFSHEVDDMVLWIGEKGEWESNFVALLLETIKPILKYIKTREKIEGALKADDPIFAGVGNRSRGKHLSENSVSRLVKNYLRKAGISVNGSSQVLRHTFSALALQSGASPFELASGLRYRSLEGIRIYLQDMKEQEKRIAQKKVSAASIESNL